MAGRAATRRTVEQGLARRYRRERLFRAAGLVATLVGVVFLAVFFATLIGQGTSAFMQTQVELEIEFDREALAAGGELDLAYADYDALLRRSLYDLFPDVTGRGDRRELFRLLSIQSGYDLREMLTGDPSLLGERVTVELPAASHVDMVIKGNIDRALPEDQLPLSRQEIGWIERLEAQGLVHLRFNSALFTNGDSREPELAGSLGALMGSL